MGYICPASPKMSPVSLLTPPVYLLKTHAVSNKLIKQFFKEILQITEEIQYNKMENLPVEVLEMVLNSNASKLVENGKKSLETCSKIKVSTYLR